MIIASETLIFISVQFPIINMQTERPELVGFRPVELPIHIFFKNVVYYIELTYMV